MTILVDTSVWSLALRRDATPAAPEVAALKSALLGDEIVVTTGLVLQELLQGMSGPKSHQQIVQRLGSLAVLNPDLDDHVNAADLRNRCRRHGVHLGTIDALLARLCIRHGMCLLSTGKDFIHAAKHSELAVWPARPQRERRRH